MSAGSETAPCTAAEELGFLPPPPPEPFAWARAKGAMGRVPVEAAGEGAAVGTPEAALDCPVPEGDGACETASLLQRVEASGGEAPDMDEATAVDACTMYLAAFAELKERELGGCWAAPSTQPSADASEQTWFVDTCEREEGALPPPPLPPVIDYDAMPPPQPAYNKEGLAEDGAAGVLELRLPAEEARRRLYEQGAVLPQSRQDAKRGAELLDAALRHRNTERVRLLLLSDRLDISLFGRALCEALQMGCEGASYILLDAGVSPNLQDTVAQPLDRRGGLNEVPGFTPLIVAARHGYELLVEELLTRGADVAARDVYGQTALMHAAVQGHDRACAALLDGGAEVNAEDVQGMTALTHAVASYEYPGNTVRLLCSVKGVDVNHAAHSTGWTPLCYAASAGREGLCQMLLECGADAKRVKSADVPVFSKGVDRYGLAECGHAGVRRMLKEHGGVAEENTPGCLLM